MTSLDPAYLQALEAHDRAVAGRELDIWLGGEPTFTDRFSTEPAWNGGALGDDKRARAGRIACALAAARPGSALVRPLGRQYPNEPAPRWCYGVYARRDGSPVWRGPADPLCGGDAGSDAVARALRDRLCRRTDGTSFEVDGALPYRFVHGRTDGAIVTDVAAEPELARPPFGTGETPTDGPRDPLAERGMLLVAVGVDDGCVRVELPQLADVAEWLRWLDLLAGACADARVGGLIISGFPPPVDETIWWSTVTPDPGVLELNMAPERGVADYYRQLAAVYDLAAEQGLSPRRLFFNGDATESGGGGHVTIGGPTAEASPWLREPRLLPRLLAYLNRHPALSYAFAPDGVGSSGQFPRPDENTRESFDELGLAVASLGAEPATSPELLWRGLAPLLADRFGNTHRTETNIEKLWNPYLPLRGQLGLVELRALRMAASPARAAAVAALFRAVIAHAAGAELPLDLVDWGSDLHDRFALPAFLRDDLDRVLADLRDAGLGLGELLEDELRDDSDRVIGRVDLDGATVTVKRALEYWPLVGDLSQEQETSRTVDASCGRIELSLAGDDAASWEAVVGGYRATFAVTATAERVLGVRYRRFAPSLGLHPQLPPTDPLELRLINPTRPGGVTIRLHAWNPSGGAYDGLPDDDDEARRRRDERFVVTQLTGVADGYPAAPPSARTRYTIDTRRLPKTSA